MKWIEVIHLRSSKQVIDDLIKSHYLDIVRPKDDEETVEMKVFRNYELATDLNIHLVREADQPKELESILGRMITKELQGEGIVNYSIWVENNGSAKNENTRI